MFSHSKASDTSLSQVIVYFLIYHYFLNIYTYLSEKTVEINKWKNKGFFCSYVPSRHPKKFTGTKLYFVQSFIIGKKMTSLVHSEFSGPLTQFFSIIRRIHSVMSFAVKNRPGISRFVCVLKRKVKQLTFQNRFFSVLVNERTNVLFEE